MLVARAQQGRSFSVEPPPALLDSLMEMLEAADSSARKAVPDPRRAAKLAAELHRWLEEQHAALARVAGEVESFTATSWELQRQFVPAASTRCHLALSDFIALLQPDQLSSVTLLLDDVEPLPAGALRALQPFPRLRELRLDTSSPIADLDCGARSPWCWFGQPSDALKVAEAGGAAALASLTQLAELSIVREGVSEASVAACAQLTALTRLELWARGLTCGLRGTRGLTSLQALQELTLCSLESEWLPPPAAFPSLRSYEYGLCIMSYMLPLDKDLPRLYVAPPALVRPPCHAQLQACAEDSVHVPPCSLQCE